MADTNFRGPINSMGSLEDVNPTVTGTTVVVPISPLDGPSVFYQGSGFPDVRSAPWNKDNYTPGSNPAFLHITDVYAVDNIPQKASTTTIATTQLLTALVNVTLLAAQPAGAASGVPSIAVGVPLIPVGTTTVTSVLALDFGFSTGTTTANSTTVNVYDNTQFQVGQWIIVGGAGNAAASQSHIAQVTSISTTNATTITILPAAVTAISNAPIGGANQFAGAFIPPATQFGGSGPSASAHAPFSAGGDSRFMNPKEMISRNISVNMATSTATSSVIVYGYDVWRNPMTEKFALGTAAVSTARTVWGAKAFKYISGISVATTAVGSAAIGIGDIFGLPFRADNFGQIQVFWNDGNASFNTSNGFLPAVTTNPATNTTGDVRGTVQMSTNGTGTALTVATAAVSNNTSRLVIVQGLGVWNTLNATPNNAVPMFGVAQSTT